MYKLIDTVIAIKYPCMYIYIYITQNPYRFLTQISWDIVNICYVKTILEVR